MRARASAQDDLKSRWLKLDAAMRSWWDGDLAHADEEGTRGHGRRGARGAAIGRGRLVTSVHLRGYGGGIEV